MIIFTCSLDSISLSNRCTMYHYIELRVSLQSTEQ